MQVRSLHSPARHTLAAGGSAGAGSVKAGAAARFSCKVRWRVTVTGSNRAVDRTASPAGTSTGGFSKGVWRVSNVNAEQLSRSARVFAGYRFGRGRRHPGGGGLGQPALPG